MSSEFLFGPDTRLIMENEPSEGERMAADWILNYLEHQLNFRIEIVPAGHAHSCGNSLVLFDAQRPGAFAAFSDIARSQSLPSGQSFRLSITERSVTVIGGSEWAVFYGAQELCQLFRKIGSRPALPVIEVVDGPAFPIRGVQLAPGIQGFDPAFCWKVLAEMSRLRMNCLVLTESEPAESPASGPAGPTQLLAAEIEGLVGFAGDYGFRIAYRKKALGSPAGQAESGWRYLPGKRSILMEKIRNAVPENSPPSGFILETGVPVNEPNFSRLGLLSAMEVLAKLCWNPEEDPPPIRPVLTNLILKPEPTER